MAGICTSSYPIEKSGIPHTHTHTHTQSMWGFPVKTGTGLDNTHGTGLFVISSLEGHDPNILKFFK